LLSRAYASGDIRSRTSKLEFIVEGVDHRRDLGQRYQPRETSAKLKARSPSTELGSHLLRHVVQRSTKSKACGFDEAHRIRECVAGSGISAVPHRSNYALRAHCTSPARIAGSPERDESVADTDLRHQSFAVKMLDRAGMEASSWV